MPRECRCLDAHLEDLPQWEPDDARYVDLNDLPANDPLWAELHAEPYALSP
ncbi:hypothetical protein [Pseudarthrobacter sp. LT1]|uniref:hypothetical protein n=1 Tax=Pseudarthrobacter sp. LT1 TaxID=3111450 RepID=UPI002D77023E|nr:hypothetical protein [Pseudarthrobacter sp. LT1]WRT14358.1 hypothetical protein VIK36_02355 [Pseudarthrobacter sp. LT1]